MNGVRCLGPLLFVMLLATLTNAALVQGITINPIGGLSVDPSSQVSQPIGTNITYTLTMTSMEVFRSWDVRVMVDPAVLRPVGTTHSFGGVETSRCIDGEGTGCTSSDGPGVVHMAVQLTYVPPVENLWGPLFKIAFKVVGDRGTAVVITDSTLVSAVRGTPLEHTASHGKYGQPPEVLSAHPSFVIVGKGGSNNSIVTLTGLGDFSGTIRLNAKVLSNTIFPAFRPRLILNPSELSLADGQTTTSTLTINGTAMTTPGTYTVNIIGTSTLTPAYTSITVLVPQVYLLHEFQYPLSIHAGESATLTSRLKNLGETLVRVVSVIVRAEFGTFTILSATPGSITICGRDYEGAILLGRGDERVLPGTITVPISARTGNHTVTVEVYWQYPDVFDIYGNQVSLWCDGRPIVLRPSFLVLGSNEPTTQPNPQPNPPPNSFSQARLDLAQLASWMKGAIVPAAGIYAGLIVLATLMILRERRRKGRVF